MVTDLAFSWDVILLMLFDCKFDVFAILAFFSVCNIQHTKIIIVNMTIKAQEQFSPSQLATDDNNYLI